MSEKNNQLQQLVLVGKITATSNRQGKFKSENPRKTAYVTMDTPNAKKAKEFGLTEYVSEDDGVKFFIIKLSPEVTVYNDDPDYDEKIVIESTIQDPNYTTSKPVGLALIKGTAEMGNDYVRLFALKVESFGKDVVFVEQRNPFETADGEPIIDFSQVTF